MFFLLSCGVKDDPEYKSQINFKSYINLNKMNYIKLRKNNLLLKIWFAKYC